LLDLTNRNELPVNQKNLLFWLKKATRLSWSALGTPICLSRKINPSVDQILERVITVTPQKTSLAQDTGHVRRGNMKVEEVLKLLEKHEEECNRRYADIQKQLDRLDVRLWGIAILIVAAAVAQRMF